MIFPTLAPCRDGLADLRGRKLGEALGEKGLALAIVR
jgi:hypothetical protein